MENAENLQNNNVPEKKKNLRLPIIAGVTALIMIALAITLIVYSNTPSQRLHKQLRLGERYLAELDYEQAVEAYLAALEIDPKDEDAIDGLYHAYTGWAESLLADGKTSEAVKRYEDALNTDPARLAAYEALLGIHAEAKDTDAIVKLYEKALSFLSDEDLDSLRNNAFAEFRKMLDEKLAAKDADAILSILEAAAKIDADMAASLKQSIIEALLKEGTEEAYRLALLLDPSCEAAYIELIDMYLAKKDYDTATQLIYDGEAACGAAVSALRSEIPYVLANDIKLEDKPLHEMIYDDYELTFVLNDGHLYDYPGLYADKGNSVLKITGITSEPLENGMKKICITASSSIDPLFYGDYFDRYWFRYSVKTPSFFDYYSGKLYKGKSTYGDQAYESSTTLDWKDSHYDVNKLTSVYWDKNWEEYIETDFYTGAWEQQYHAAEIQTYTITVPQDYDGLVMYFEKTAGPFGEKSEDYYTDEAQKLREENADNWMAEDHFLLDADSEGTVPDPDKYYYFRLTDDFIKQFNAQ